MARPTGCSLRDSAAARRAQDLPLVAGERVHLGHPRAPLGQRPGLVDQHGGRPRQDLERRPPAEQDPHLRRPARADHDGRGRRQPHGAGAGDHQHRHRGDEGVAQRGRRAERDPRREGHRRHRHHHGHEHGGDAVGQRLHGGLRPLRLLDEADDLGEQRLRPHAGGAEDERPAAVHRAAGHGRALAHLHGRRLAGDGRRVDEAQRPPPPPRRPGGARPAAPPRGRRGRPRRWPRRPRPRRAAPARSAAGGRRASRSPPTCAASRAPPGTCPRG